MKIKINKILFVLLILSSVNFFSFKLLPNFIFRINSNQQIFLSIIIIFIMIVINKSCLLYKQDLFRTCILIFYISSMLSMFYTLFALNQSFWDTLIAGNYILGLIAYFPISYYLRNGGYFFIRKVIMVVTLVGLIIFLIQYILYSKNILIVSINEDDMRYGSFYISDLGNIIYTLGIFFYLEEYISTKKIKFFFIFFLGMVEIIYVNKGRMLIVTFVLCCTTYILLKYRKNFSKLPLILISILVLFVLFLNSGFGETLIKSFDSGTGNVHRDTYSVRINEIDYYIASTKKSVFLGLGFLRDKTGSYFEFLLRGPTLQYSRTDVGIIGLYNTLGILGVLIYSLLVIKLFIFTKLKWKWILCNDKYIYIIVTLLILFYSPTLIMTDPQRIVSFGLILALFNFGNLESKK